MSDKKQTAVRLLAQEIKEIIGPTDNRTQELLVSRAIRKAEEMHKKQMIEFANDYEQYSYKAYLSNRYSQAKSAEQYYEETYENN